MQFIKHSLKALLSYNVLLTKVVSIPLVIIEEFIIMSFIIFILNIKVSKKQKILFIFISSIIEILCSIILPKAYFILLSFLSIAITIKFVFKVNFLNAIFSELIPIIFIVIVETIINGIIVLSTKISSLTFSYIPLFKIILSLISYFFIYIIYNFLKKYNYYIHFSNLINQNEKIIIIYNIIITLIILLMQIFLITYYYNILPSFIIFMDIILLISYFLFNFLSLDKIFKLEKTKLALEQEKLSYKSLQIVHDSTRAFKHDFSNIIAGIGGYIQNNDLTGLKKYYNQLFSDCTNINNYSKLNPESINNPAIYTLLANKFYKAESLNIKINLDCFINFNELNMEIYEFNRILGILLDNAIEASSECADKIINISIFNNLNSNSQILKIENSYKNIKLDLSKLNKKGFSTKKNNSGLGLWEVEKIINKHKNISKNTTKNKEFFIQTIEIFKE